MIWQEIKDFSNTLSEEELKQPVKGWDEDRTYTVKGVERTEEDRYWDGYMHIPSSAFDSFPEDVDDVEDILPKGTVRLNLD